MPDSAADELDLIAAELYALPPGEFTAARNARAAASDRALAARIKTLRKPVVSAWAVGLLVRGGLLAEALELSAALREAQEDLDAAELSALSRQRRALVAALAGQAVELAKAHGVAVSAAARDDVAATVNAAMMDAAAAAAVMSGRLVTPLVAGAFEPDDLADAVSGSLPGAQEAAPRDDLAERRARKAAEKTAREAERLANEAARELSRVDARRQKARERVDHLAERIDDLTGELERLHRDAATAAAELERREADVAQAAARAETAERESDAARRALD
jgi:hypothetical protein